MSLGPLMLDLTGLMPTEQEKEILQHPLVGGVILFSRNYESPAQLIELTSEIHALRNPHLIIAVDHEGGRVQRFQRGFTRLPPMAAIGKLYREDAKYALQVAEQMGWLLSAELLSCGVDISFAPVLDIAHGVSGVIGDRAFHRDPEIVALLAQALMRGMRQAGMAATGKHFPGHGGVKEDSHIAKPVEKRVLADLMMADIEPFRRLIANGLAGIMPAHVVYPDVDDKPAGYSHRWLTDILRGELGFQGVIFSDDLSMDAANIGNTFTERARLALQAGCDMVLVCNDPEAACEVVEGLGEYNNPAAQLRLIRMHGKKQLELEALQKRPEWQQANKLAAGFVEQQSLELGI